MSKLKRNEGDWMGVKVGDKVRIVRDTVNHGFPVGSVVTVSKVTKDGMILAERNGLNWAITKDCEKVEGDTLELIAKLSAEVVRLSKRVELLESAIIKRHVAGSDGPGRLPTREEIIENAKADIDGLKGGKHYDVGTPTSWASCESEFVVNREKRTVVCLLRGFITKKVHAKGKSKCAPDDCFNVHIGKAIALRRALGLEVPEEYVKAPQPTEAKLGDVVFSKNSRLTYTVTQRYTRVLEEIEIDAVRNGDLLVIDDSRE